jgi:D-alanyl-D-alanine dipeptidase
LAFKVLLTMSARVLELGFFLGFALGLVSLGAAADDLGAAPPPAELPPGFVDLAEVAPEIAVDLRYAGAQNFVGRTVRGYLAPRCLLSRSAAVALAQIEEDLAPRGLGLLVYDCYRPQRAVDDFVAWAHDLDDSSTRDRHYPAVAKSELFQRGYIAARSGHTRGSTVDLTLIPMPRAPDAAAAAEPVDCRLPGGTGPGDGSLDMGTTFDCFDDRSRADHPALSPRARRHRRLLRAAMARRGFSAYAKEWWHFRLAREPFPDRYFNFEVR